MIHQIYANNDKFKPILFEKGLNIILADTEEESTDDESRNGLGKTTLMYIIHFCLGSKPDSKRIPEDHISDWNFYIEVDLFNEKILASRSISNPDIVVIEGNFEKFQIKPERNSDEDYYYYDLQTWKKLLGKSLFGLEEPYDTGYSPSFRNLIPYFIRRRTAEFETPFKHENNKHKHVNWKVCTAFCLGLNWKLVSKYQELLDENKKLNKRKGFLNDRIGSNQGALQPERIRLEIEVNNIKKELDSFKVHASYKEIEKNANQLTKYIHELTNELIFLNQKLQKYEESIIQEQAPNNLAIEKLYENAGMHFPDNIKKRLEDVKLFHEKIIENRKDFLKSEIIEINSKISQNENEINEKSIQKSKYMNILANFGALKEYTDIQGIYSEKKQKLENIKSLIDEFQSINASKNIIKENKLILESEFQLDYKESAYSWEKTVALFSENSKYLYGHPGNLIINLTERGYDFDIDIPKSKSEGITKMQTFCYDLMLVEFFSEKNQINFLIHDSPIFSGVDSRQYAKSLKLAHKKAIAKNFQYICTLNSDTIPYAHLGDDWNINNFVRLTLHDKDPKGSLFGFEF